MTGVVAWLPVVPTWSMPSGVCGEVVDLNVTLPRDLSGVDLVVLPYGPNDAALTALARMPKLQVVQSLAAGVDRVAPLVPDHVLLCSGRGIHDTATAELGITLSLAALRGIPGFLADQTASRWLPRDTPGLADKTVLVIGHGSIGAAIAQRLRSFEARVVPVGRTALPGVRAVTELRALLPEAQVVILAVPLTPATRGLVDRRFLAAMPRGALLVNVARGAVVVTDDLVDALHRGEVTAALDVTDPEPLPAGHPLWTAPNVILTPHVGARSEALPSRMQRFLQEQITRFAKRRPLLNVVNRH